MLSIFQVLTPKQAIYKSISFVKDYCHFIRDGKGERWIKRCLFLGLAQSRIFSKKLVRFHHSIEHWHIN